MSRIVIHSAVGPVVIKVGSQSVSICRCGLTSNKDGTCCGNHNKTAGEDATKIYSYDEKLEREEVGEECCGEGDCECCNSGAK